MTWIRILQLNVNEIVRATAAEWNQLRGGGGRCKVPEHHTVGHRGLDKVIHELGSRVVVQFENGGGATLI